MKQHTLEFVAARTASSLEAPVKENGQRVKKRYAPSPNCPSETDQSRIRSQSTLESYRSFVIATNEAGLKINDLTSETEAKRALLQNSFYRFGQHGAQPISEYSSAQTGALFQRIYNFATRALSR